MAHHTDKVGFPNIPMRTGMIMKLEARDPTTDAEVAGVTASRWSIFGYDDSVSVVVPEPQLPVVTLGLEA